MISNISNFAVACLFATIQAGFIDRIHDAALGDDSVRELNDSDHIHDDFSDDLFFHDKAQ
jgi:hypothetical protein